MQAKLAPNTLEIVEAIADEEEIDVVELPPLHDVIDLEALEALFSPTVKGDSRGKGCVTFLYYGHTVTVYSDGCVRLDEQEKSKSFNKA